MEDSVSSGKNLAATNQSHGIRLKNPVTLKVGQIFTGFGIGCGIGIGVGRPINLGAIPMVSQVVSASRGATDALSGVSQQANNILRKLGSKSFEAGIGCGVGFGHGFGVGLALNPGVVQNCFVNMKKMMTKFGIDSSAFSLQNGLSLRAASSIQNQMGSITQVVTTNSESTFQGLDGYGNIAPGSTDCKFGTKNSEVDKTFGRTKQVISNFKQDPVFSEDTTSLNEVVRQLHSGNSILQVVLRHQRIIEELREENEKLCQTMMEVLEINTGKPQMGNSRQRKSPCRDCFHCRRKERKSR